jgi:transglycosylase-like protein with SLT domain
MRETSEPKECVWASRSLRGNAQRGLVAALLALASGPAVAEDFTFRRVGVPNASSSNRITVQIGVETAKLEADSDREFDRPPARPDTAPIEGGTTAAARAAGVEWFWAEVSPLLSASHPERLEEALKVLAGAPAGDEIIPPQLGAVQSLADLYGADILRLTAGTRVSPAMVLAVMAVESAGRSDAVSHAGAAGLMQLMPATAARFGVEDRLEPGESIRGGVAYLDWLLKHFGNDPVLALAAYNAGEGAVETNGGVPPYSETRAYVPKVLAAWAVAQDLCQTSPDAGSGGCMTMVAGL